MAEPAWLADQFEHWRPHLASVAYGMLGSVSEAEDAVQQAWLRPDHRPDRGSGAAGLLFGT
jgi:DNA-directed RNA polymerase specialized sigma24 family protein